MPRSAHVRKGTANIDWHLRGGDEGCAGGRRVGDDPHHGVCLGRMKRARVHEGVLRGRE